MAVQTDDLQGDDFRRPRVVSAAPASPNEEALERALRPKRLQEYVGQAKAREQLESFVGAARHRAEAERKRTGGRPDTRRLEAEIFARTPPIVGDDPRLRHFIARAANAALAAAADPAADAEGAVIKAMPGHSPRERALAEAAAAREHDRRE